MPVSYTHLMCIRDRLWGSVGTGKSFFAACIANALMEKEIPVRMTNFAAVLKMCIRDRGCSHKIRPIRQFPVQGIEFKNLCLCRF